MYYFLSNQFLNKTTQVVKERESIRTLCDKLRRERDRAVSELAEALRDLDEVKKNRNEVFSSPFWTWCRKSIHGHDNQSGSYICIIYNVCKSGEQGEQGAS